jgi:hypothetical protein
LARSPSSPGTAGCITNTGSGGACTDGTAIDRGFGIKVSPDGGSVYVAMNTISTVGVFARNPSTGVLTQLPGTAGCTSDSGTGGTCTDGTNLYVELNGGVAVLARDAATGALTQAPGTNAASPNGAWAAVAARTVSRSWTRPTWP